MSLILIERTLNIKKQSWGCTGFDARPARTMGKPSEAKRARWSREKQCRVARAIRAGFSSGAVYIFKQNNLGDVLVLTL